MHGLKETKGVKEAFQFARAQLEHTRKKAMWNFPITRIKTPSPGMECGRGLCLYIMKICVKKKMTLISDFDCISDCLDQHFRDRLLSLFNHMDIIVTLLHQ